MFQRSNGFPKDGLFWPEARIVSCSGSCKSHQNLSLPAAAPLQTSVFVESSSDFGPACDGNPPEVRRVGRKFVEPMAKSVSLVICDERRRLIVRSPSHHGKGGKFLILPPGYDPFSSPTAESGMNRHVPSAIIRQVWLKAVEQAGRTPILSQSLCCITIGNDWLVFGSIEMSGISSVWTIFHHARWPPCGQFSRQGVLV